MKLDTKAITRASIIAAIYTAISLLLAPISFGQVQVRLSEALTLLPIFLPEAVPALFIGCLISNMIGGMGILDIVFGSLCTLIAAIFTYLLRKKSAFISAAPPVIINAFGVAAVLHFASGLPYFITVLWVGLGQVLSVYFVGIPLMALLKKRLFNDL
ncbi:MAG: QueT transporter family protein [Clostridia bacterium]|nr:QueT transporter family protein [Clostridia bacterium]MBQ4638488.1 QueT transporter family protein [Clostridia bacterium]